MRYPKPGDKVKIVERENYGTGNLTEGIVRDILTKIRDHPRGTKVRLTNGIIGRVQEFPDDPKKEHPERGELADKVEEKPRVVDPSELASISDPMDLR